MIGHLIYFVLFFFYSCLKRHFSRIQPDLSMVSEFLLYVYVNVFMFKILSLMRMVYQDCVQLLATLQPGLLIHLLGTPGHIPFLPPNSFLPSSLIPQKNWKSLKGHKYSILHHMEITVSCERLVYKI